MRSRFSVAMLASVALRSRCRGKQRGFTAERRKVPRGEVAALAHAHRGGARASISAVQDAAQCLGVIFLALERGAPSSTSKVGRWPSILRMSAWHPSARSTTPRDERFEHF
jgi:hypothetical protein